MTAPAIATAAASASSPTSWLDYQHPHHAAMAARWQFALDHYTGDLLLPERIQLYLLRRMQGEPRDSYEERCRIADYVNHYGTIVDSLAGMLFANDEETTRVWGAEGEQGLGDPDNPKSIAGQLIRDADGHGCGWKTLHKRLLSRLLVLQESWGLVTSPDGRPRLTYLDPLAVTDWITDAEGHLTQVKVREQVLQRDTIETAPKPANRWTVYSLEGWQRYEKSADGKAVRLEGEEHQGAYQFVEAGGKSALPIFRVQLPLGRYVGWLLARNANAIFNHDTARDFLLWTSNFSKLKLAAGNSLYDSLVQSLQQGANVLQDDPQFTKSHGYIAPNTGPVTVGLEVAKQRIQNFYITAFREYGDAARERTATEVRQDVSAGVGALLQMLKSAADDAENAALWRIEQTQWPETPARWYKARTERSDNFLPPDVNMVIDRLTTRYFGKDGVVPVGRAGRLAIARTIAGYEGIEVDDDELRTALDAAAVVELVNSQVLASLDLPADARVELAIRMAEGLGLVGPAAGTAADKAPLDREQLKAAALELASGKDEQARHLAELTRAAGFGGPPPDDDDSDDDPADE